MDLDYLSHTKINMLHKCGEQYRRRYIEGEIAPPGIALLKGRAVAISGEKNLSQKMETGEPMTLEEVADVTRDAFHGETQGTWVIDGDYEGMSAREAKAKGTDHAIDMALVYASEFVPVIEPTGIETRIEIPAGNTLPVPFVAILDVIDRDVFVRDTKTSGKAPNASVADESEQLTGYAIAYTALKGKPPVDLSLDYVWRTMKTGKTGHRRLTTERGPDRFRVWTRRALAAVEMIRKEVFLPAPVDSWACSERYCGYASTCPFYAGRKRPTS